MNGLDLFSGIGGLTKALQGYVRPVAYCENDRYAQAVLLSRMWTGDLPWAPIADDVRELRGVDFISPVDIIYGGFPCQDISVAGLGAGLAGKRSGLFFEIVRLVSELRPRFVFLENVSAIRVRGGSVVCGELARLGYDCRWDMLSASDVGANHERERWWLLAKRRKNVDDTEGGNMRYDSPNNGSTVEPINTPASAGLLRRTEDVADAECDGREGRGEERDAARSSGLCDGERRDKIETISAAGGWWKSEPNVGRVAHGVPLRVDRLRGLGNSVVPTQAREAFERLMGLK